MKSTERSDVAESRTGVRAALVAGTAVLVALLAACSSSDAGPAPEPAVTSPLSSDSVEEPETTTTTTSTTTVLTTTTTDPPPVVETVAPESSEPAPETTVGEPLPVPTNTTFDPETLEGEVEQAALANLIAFFVCAEQLPSCDAVSATRFAALEYADGNTRIIEDANSAGYEIRNGTDYTVAVESVEIFSDGLEAFAVTCVWDGTQLVSPATSDADEEIIDSGNASRRDRYAMRLLGDAWLVTARDSIERADGREADLCG